MRTSTGVTVVACALSAALIVAGCGGNADQGSEPSAEVFLEPAAAKGPDPFTDSTATAPAIAAPVTRTPQPARSGETRPRHLSGGTPGLYGGSRGTGSCDVERQIGHLASDRDRARAFARAAGMPRSAVPGWLRDLTSVVLRADTHVTNHRYRAGRATGYQSVLQAGTAVLVDNHGVPRVRCACGNPLTPAAGLRGEPGTHGRPWPGYRPAQVIVVAPTAQAVTGITIIDVADHTWIERPTGHRGHDHDHALPRPNPAHPDPAHPDPHASAPGTAPGEDGGIPTGDGMSPSGGPTSPNASPTDCAPPTATVPPGVTDEALAESASHPSGPPSTAPADCPTATGTAPATPKTPERTPRSPGKPNSPDSGTAPGTSPKSTDSAAETGPEAVPESPDLPDGGGLVPDAPETSDSIFGSPTDVFDG
ncbi:DUF6777 domain-containing protein [Streptomyces sp. M41]|uniref:DUF6777 domain-containing protein n=1 Tax=Streptomyces sp. M41 TaxID=3059412 RepID=UPI00374DF399